MYYIEYDSGGLSGCCVQNIKYISDGIDADGLMIFLLVGLEFYVVVVGCGGETVVYAKRNQLSRTRSISTK